MACQPDLELILYKCLVREKRVPRKEEVAIELGVSIDELGQLDSVGVLPVVYRLENWQKERLIELAGLSPERSMSLQTLFALVKESRGFIVGADEILLPLSIVSFYIGVLVTGQFSQFLEGSTLGPWMLGLSFSVLLGFGVTKMFEALLRGHMNLPKDVAEDLPARGTRPFPSWLTGVVERTFFTVLVAFASDGAPAAMIAWLGIKLAANWNSPRRDDSGRSLPQIRQSFLALMVGAISMTFAFIGGLIVKE